MAKKICSKGMSEMDPSSPAAEKVAGNEDLVKEIFLRLPVRYLIKFTSVSKQWSSLISDPQFARNHNLRRNPSSLIPSGVFFYNSLTRSEEIESISLDGGPNQTSRVRVPSLSFLDAASGGATMKVLQSCNGLLLCSFTSKSGDSSEVRTDYCVCNPTTKKYTIIPQPCLTPLEFVIHVSLAFDPLESPHYRVACVKKRSLDHHLRGGKRYLIDMYSSENGFWRTSVCCFNESMEQVYNNGVYWNGVIYWFANYWFAISWCGYQIKCYSIQFDINTENLMTIEMPLVPQSSCLCSIMYIGEFSAHLHVIYFVNNTILVLENDRDTLKWSVKYQVDISLLTSAFPEIVQKTINSFGIGVDNYYDIEYAFSVLSVVEGENDEDWGLVLTIPGKVISYKFKHKTTKVLCELPRQVVCSSIYASISSNVTAYPYVESLASV